MMEMMTCEQYHRYGDDDLGKLELGLGVAGSFHDLSQG
jgi:hypothetical protein